MKKQLAKLALTAAIGLALTLLACEDKEKKQTPAETQTAEPVAAPSKAEAAREAYIKENGGTFTDSRDKKTYKTIKIGEQVWMAENLNIETGKSGCYDENPDNCKKYGRLYDWETAQTACPIGWHLPSKKELEVLEAAVGGKCNGTDNFGFSALPGGYKDFGCDCDDGFRGGYLGVGEDGYWWSANEISSFNAYILGIHCTDGRVYYEGEKDFGGGYGAKWDWLSVRCIKGDAKEAKAKEIAEVLAAAAKAKGGTFTDTRNSKTYKTVKIGEQTWMAENLNIETGKSVCYENDSANCEKYGRLYDWETAKTACPKSWHLPNNGEWDKLTEVAGGKSHAGKYLKATNGWEKDGNGTDNFGFSALPSPRQFNSFGDWWSSSESNAVNAYYLRMYYDGEYVSNDPLGKSFLNSIRCVQDF